MSAGRPGPRLALALCGLVVLADQGSKALAGSAVDQGERIELLPFLAIEKTRNSGVAFGLGGDASPLLIALTVVIVVGLLGFVAVQVRGPRIWVAAGLLIGGALGNLADRAREGAVIDFIDLPAWPTFNLADLAIVVGVIVLLFTYERDREQTGAEGSPDPG